MTINAGDTILWTWQSGFHTVTSVAGSIETFDSGFKGAGETFSHKFMQAGDYVYYCQAHGTDTGHGTATGMFATVHVNAVPEPVMGLIIVPAMAMMLGRRQRRSPIR